MSTIYTHDNVCEVAIEVVPVQLFESVQVHRFYCIIILKQAPEAHSNHVNRILRPMRGIVVCHVLYYTSYG